MTDPACPNCDGRGCMGCVLRRYVHDCADDCPVCCPTPKHPDEIRQMFAGELLVQRHDSRTTMQIEIEGMLNDIRDEMETWADALTT
jgi:hypothetical protein